MHTPFSISQSGSSSGQLESDEHVPEISSNDHISSLILFVYSVFPIFLKI